VSNAGRSEAYLERPAAYGAAYSNALLIAPHVVASTATVLTSMTQMS
jgi:hypothetical protein